MKFKKLIAAVGAVAMLGSLVTVMPASAEGETVNATVITAAQFRGDGGYTTLNSKSNEVKGDVNAAIEVNAASFMGAFYQFEIPAVSGYAIDTVTIDFDKVNNIGEFNRIIAVDNPDKVNVANIGAVIAAKNDDITKGVGVELKRANNDWAETDITSIVSTGTNSIFVYSSRTSNSTKYDVKNPVVNVTYKELDNKVAITTAAQFRGDGGYTTLNSKSNEVKGDVNAAIEVNAASFMGAFYQFEIPAVSGYAIDTVTIDFDKVNNTGEFNRIIAVDNPNAVNTADIGKVIAAKNDDITKGVGVELKRANNDWAETDITSIVSTGTNSIFVYSSRTGNSTKYDIKNPVVRVTYKESAEVAPTGMLEFIQEFKGDQYEGTASAYTFTVVPGTANGYLSVTIGETTKTVDTELNGQGSVVFGVVAESAEGMSASIGGTSVTIE